MSTIQELELLRALLRASDYGVLLSDLDRHDRVCNDRFCELFGLDPEGTVGAPPEVVRSLVLPRIKDPDSFIDTLNKIYSSPTLIWEDELELRGNPGKILRRHSAPVFDDFGNVMGRVWTFLDITNTKRLESRVHVQSEQLKLQARALAAALKSANGRLTTAENNLTQTQQLLLESEKLSAVGLLAASVAHDIRNILTPLCIELELANDDDHTRRQVSLESMRSQIDRLSLLTHRLLALSKPQNTEHVHIDIALLLEKTVDLLRVHARHSDVKIHFRPSRTRAIVTGDAVQLDQVLVNIMLNAIQAMVQGGNLTVKMGTSKSGYKIQIIDDGPGIPPLIRRRLFDPFFTTKPDGAGLGLFSCQRIVVAHGGTLKVRSVIETGTTFTVWLPKFEVNHGR